MVRRRAGSTTRSTRRRLALRPTPATAGASSTAPRSTCARRRTRSSTTHSRAPSTSATGQAAARARPRRSSSSCAATIRRARLQSDFYSYRYFASEGFLPGYSFPRLPLSAFIPARRGRQGQGRVPVSARGSSRSREFGPRSIVYHEGSRYLINRVILPVERDEDNRLADRSRSKQCASCGYLHPVDGRRPGPRPLRALRRAARRRRSRSSSACRTSRPSAATGSTPTRRSACARASRSGPASASPSATGRGQRVAHVVVDGDDAGARSTYGDAATLWRINLGWTRRKDTDVLGLRARHRAWLLGDRTTQAAADDKDDPMSQPQRARHPVRRGPSQRAARRARAAARPSVMASLAGGAQERDPGRVRARGHRARGRAAARPRRPQPAPVLRGGRGRRRRAAPARRRPGRARRASRAAALELCHFDPDTGDDLRHAPGAREDCEAACYDCLLSYANQRDHRLLDRIAIARAPADARRRDGRGRRPDRCRAPSSCEQLDAPRATPSSRSSWLDVPRRADGYELPTHAQQAVERRAGTARLHLRRPLRRRLRRRPAPRLRRRQRARRRAGDRGSRTLGYTVIRFGHDETTGRRSFAGHPERLREAAQ